MTAVLLRLPGVRGRADTRLRALEADYGASVTVVGGECVVHVPRVRVAPGPHGVRSVTIHGESWEVVLAAFLEIVSDDTG